MSQGARQRVQCSPRSQSDQAYKSDQRGLHLATLSIQKIYRQLPDARHPQRFCLHASTGQCQVWSMVGLPWIGIVLACPTDARSDWDVGNLRAWVDTLRSLSCSYHHSWEVFAMCWYPHESQDQQFLSRTLHHKEMINCIHFTWQGFYHRSWSVYGYSIPVPTVHLCIPFLSGTVALSCTQCNPYVFCMPSPVPHLLTGGESNCVEKRFHVSLKPCPSCGGMWTAQFYECK